MAWVPFEYRDFYDIPRIFVVRHDNELFLFDCRFSPHADDYSSRFDVYALPASLEDSLGKISWEGLSAAGRAVGSVETSSVEFDDSQRRLVNDEVFAKIK